MYALQAFVMSEIGKFKSLRSLLEDSLISIQHFIGIGDECGRVLGGAVASRVAEARA